MTKLVMRECDDNLFAGLTRKGGEHSCSQKVSIANKECQQEDKKTTRNNYDSCEFLPLAMMQLG
jgi:hypothetical protein